MPKYTPSTADPIQRWGTHRVSARWSTKPLYDRMRVFGAETFSMKVLEVFPSDREARQRERALVLEAIDAGRDVWNVAMNSGRIRAIRNERITSEQEDRVTRELQECGGRGEWCKIVGVSYGAATTFFAGGTVSGIIQRHLNSPERDFRQARIEFEREDHKKQQELKAWLRGKMDGSVDDSLSVGAKKTGYSATTLSKKLRELGYDWWERLEQRSVPGVTLGERLYRKLEEK